MALVLRYGDAQVNSHDMETIQPGEWVGDAIIEFYYEYLAEAVFPNNKRSILFLQPAVAHLIGNVQDASFLAGALPPDIKDKPLIFAPINDSAGDGGGGSHWSLLVFFRPTNSFYYYDSMGAANLSHAHRTMKALFAIVSGSESSSLPILTRIDTPMQVNGYDCGVYVMAITHLLCTRIIDRGLDLAEKPGDLSAWRLSHSIPPDFITKKRKDIRELILKLASASQPSQ
ncbi:hypothetical protein BC831DRAFT_440348, partial [Entophlyctis helioformis]